MGPDGVSDPAALWAGALRTVVARPWRGYASSFTDQVAGRRSGAGRPSTSGSSCRAEDLGSDGAPPPGSCFHGADSVAVRAGWSVYCSPGLGTTGSCRARGLCHDLAEVQAVHARPARQIRPSPEELGGGSPIPAGQMSRLLERPNLLFRTGRVARLDITAADDDQEFRGP